MYIVDYVQLISFNTRISVRVYNIKCANTCISLFEFTIINYITDYRKVKFAYRGIQLNT